MSKIDTTTGAPKGKLDIITFIYGFGAAIVLVGAMFKFLGWPYANELFIVGLSIEAIVFLISAFERKEEEVEYRWEQVFPQLTSGGAAAEMGGYHRAMQEFEGSLRVLTQRTGELSETLATIREQLQETGQGSHLMKSELDHLNREMEHYNKNLRAINQRYDTFLKD